jgi:TonB family protein
MKTSSLIFTAVLSVMTAHAAEPFFYSEAPLQQKPLLTAVEVAAGTARFYNPLDERRMILSEPRKSERRRQAYLVIDSILKRQREEGRADLEDSEKTALRMLLDRSTQLGVYGAGLVAREIGGPEPPLVSEPLLPPDPLALRLDFPRFVVSSRSATWRLEFPWYFMLWEAKHAPGKNGLETDLVAVSTSFAGQEEPGGPSPADILFIHSPAEDCGVFDASWLELLGMNLAEKTDDAPLASASHYVHQDPGTHLRRELTLSARKDGCVAFVYEAFTGPAVANSVSYLDFIRSFSDSGPAPAVGSATQASWRPCPPGQKRYLSRCYTKPVLKKAVLPVYPGKALQERVEGEVVVQARLAPNGSVISAVVEDCTHPGYGFETAATQAVRKWRYKASTVKDWPPDVPYAVVVTFEMPHRRVGKGKMPPPYAAETLEAKRRKVLAFMSNLWCRDDLQCASLAVGSQPCGIPRENRLYSAGSVEVWPMFELVADYNAYEAGWNEQEGVTSACSTPAEVKPACVKHQCIDLNLSP